MTIDIERLREDVIDECMAAAFVGGFGGALFSARDAELASERKLISMAEELGLNIRDYLTE